MSLPAVNSWGFSTLRSAGERRFQRLFNYPTRIRCGDG